MESCPTSTCQSQPASTTSTFASRTNTSTDHPSPPRSQVPTCISVLTFDSCCRFYPSSEALESKDFQGPGGTLRFIYKLMHIVCMVGFVNVEPNTTPAHLLGTQSQ